MNRLAKILTALTALAFVMACGAAPLVTHVPSRRPSPLDTLRARATSAPQDAAIWRELAEAEALSEFGDPARAGPAMSHARELAPNDPTLALLSAALHELHGEPTDAYRDYVEVLRIVAEHSTPASLPLAELAASSLSNFATLVPDAAELDAAIALLRSQPHRVGYPAFLALTDLAEDLAWRRGDVARVRELAREQGCPEEWRIVGPFGPGDLLGFDLRLAPENDSRLVARYDRGPGRGSQDTRAYRALGCQVRLGDRLRPMGGTTYAQAIVQTAPGNYLLRVESPNAVEVMIDGRRALRVDRRSRVQPSAAYSIEQLTAGEHVITVKVSSRHPNPIFRASLLEFGTAPLTHLGLTGVGGSTPSAVYLRALLATFRGDPVTGRQLFAGAPNSESELGGALPQLLRASIALSDPLRPADVTRDAARQALSRAKERDPGAWYATTRLATLEAQEGRQLAAIQALEQAATRWPGVLDIQLTLAEQYLDRGWLHDAAVVIGRARELAPNACRPVDQANRLARRLDQGARAVELAEELVGCDARSTARLVSLVERRQWDAAAAELGRLESFAEPEAHADILDRRLELARGRGDARAIASLIVELEAQMPRSARWTLAAADVRLARGNRPQALQLLAEAVRRDPAAMGGLETTFHALGAERKLERFRLDGRQVVREFEAARSTYDAPEVLVLDYTVVRLFEDGSSLELTHNILHLRTDEAVDARGEYQTPDGAHLLTLHTIKADGTVIEPDDIEGKETISLPDLAPNDFLEVEYLRFHEASAAFVGGFIGERFYFQSYETPFHRSQLTVVSPRSMPLVIDPRGPAPAVVETSEGDLRVQTFLVRSGIPLVPEPMAVHATEFVASVRLAFRATWESLHERLRDALADLDPWDPDAEAVARQVAGPSTNDDTARARRLYAWVVTNIEQGGGLFQSAPRLFHSRAGSRVRVLRYLLGLAGIESRLVAARIAQSDHTPTVVAESETYPQALLRLERTGQLLYADERWAPFGYLPPQVRGEEAIVLGPTFEKITVRASEPGEDLRTREVTVHVRPDGSAMFDVVEVYRGALAVAWRTQLERIASAELNRRFEEGYVSGLVSGATLDDLSIDSVDAVDSPLRFRFRFHAAGVARPDDDDRSMGRVTGLFTLDLAGDLAGPSERTTTELLPASLEAELDVWFAAFAARALPRQVAAEPHTVLSGPSGARFEQTVEASERAETRGVHVRRSLRIPATRIVPVEYAAFSSFCRRVDAAERAEIRVPFTDR